MKRILFMSLISSLLMITACSNDMEQNETIEIPPLSGDIDPALLIGKWDCIKFAYIAEDKTISDVTVLLKGHIVIPNMEDRWIFVYMNEIFYDHSLSGNLITLTASGSSFAMPPQEETDICEALANAYRFTIKDNELMVYFTGDENKNLLIFKRVES